MTGPDPADAFLTPMTPPPRILRPSWKRTALRALLPIPLAGLAVGNLLDEPIWWQVLLAVGLIGVALWLWAMTALVLFSPRAYELHLDTHGFRAHDLFGRPVHDVAWAELAALFPVRVSASWSAVGFLRSPRPPKEGRWRWRRGTAEDDGCMPDTYGMDPSELVELMTAFWQAGAGHGEPRASAPTGLSAF